MKCLVIAPARDPGIIAEADPPYAVAAPFSNRLAFIAVAAMA